MNLNEIAARLQRVDPAQSLDADPKGRDAQRLLEDARRRASDAPSQRLTRRQRVLVAVVAGASLVGAAVAAGAFVAGRAPEGTNPLAEHRSVVVEIQERLLEGCYELAAAREVIDETMMRTGIASYVVHVGDDSAAAPDLESGVHPAAEHIARGCTAVTAVGATEDGGLLIMIRDKDSDALPSESGRGPTSATTSP